MKMLILFLFMSLIIAACKEKPSGNEPQTFSIAERTALFTRIMQHEVQDTLIKSGSGNKLNPSFQFPFATEIFNQALDSLKQVCTEYSPLVANFIFEDNWQSFGQVKYRIKDKFSQDYYDMEPYTAFDMSYYCQPISAGDKMDLVLRTLRIPYTVNFKDSIIVIQLKTHYHSKSKWAPYLAIILDAYSDLIYAYIMLKEKRYKELRFKTENTDENEVKLFYFHVSDESKINYERVKQNAVSAIDRNR